MVGSAKSWTSNTFTLKEYFPILANCVDLEVEKFLMSLGAYEEIERRLWVELNRAEKEYMSAEPLHKTEMRRRFEQALERFTLFILEGKLPEDS